MVKVLIAIQAKSNSPSFSQKIYQLIGQKMVIQHVVDAAKSAKLYVERLSNKNPITCDVAILYPKGDSQIFTTCKSICTLVEAPTSDESDVLSRFVKAMEVTKSDYIVRLTSDCPLVLDFVISKHINTCVLNNLDYVTNVFNNFRFAFDGLDVEVLSKKAITWLKENAQSDLDKEHVTRLIQTKFPQELKCGFVTHKLDTSGVHLSLDSIDDLERIRNYYHEREYKLSLSLQQFGKKNIYEI